MITYIGKDVNLMTRLATVFKWSFVVIINAGRKTGLCITMYACNRTSAYFAPYELDNHFLSCEFPNNDNYHSKIFKPRTFLQKYYMSSYLLIPVSFSTSPFDQYSLSQRKYFVFLFLKILTGSTVLS